MKHNYYQFASATALHVTPPLSGMKCGAPDQSEADSTSGRLKLTNHRCEITRAGISNRKVDFASTRLFCCKPKKEILKTTEAAF